MNAEHGEENVQVKPCKAVSFGSHYWSFKTFVFRFTV